MQQLRQQHVDFTIVQLQPGDIIVFVAGAYYQGWTTGDMVAECAYYGNTLSLMCFVGYDSCRWALAFDRRLLGPLVQGHALLAATGL